MVLHDGQYRLTPKHVLLTYQVLCCRDGYTPVMVALWFQRLEALRFFIKVVFHSKLFSPLFLLFHYLIEWHSLIFCHAYLHFDQYLLFTLQFKILKVVKIIKIKIKILIHFKTQGNANQNPNPIENSGKCWPHLKSPSGCLRLKGLLRSLQGLTFYAILW